jgi:hypothetical protein
MKDTLLLAAVALVVVILIILTIKVRRTRRTKVSESWSSVTKEEFLSILLGTYSATQRAEALNVRLSLGPKIIDPPALAEISLEASEAPEKLAPESEIDLLEKDMERSNHELAVITAQDEVLDVSSNTEIEAEPSAESFESRTTSSRAQSPETGLAPQEFITELAAPKRQRFSRGPRPPREPKARPAKPTRAERNAKRQAEGEARRSARVAAKRQRAEYLDPATQSPREASSSDETLSPSRRELRRQARDLARLDKQARRRARNVAPTLSIDADTGPTLEAEPQVPFSPPAPTDVPTPDVAPPARSIRRAERNAQRLAQELNTREVAVSHGETLPLSDAPPSEHDLITDAVAEATRVVEGSPDAPPKRGLFSKRARSSPSPKTTAEAMLSPEELRLSSLEAARDTKQRTKAAREAARQDELLARQAARQLSKHEKEATRQLAAQARSAKRVERQRAADAKVLARNESKLAKAEERTAAKEFKSIVQTPQPPDVTTPARQAHPLTTQEPEPQLVSLAEADIKALARERKRLSRVAARAERQEAKHQEAETVRAMRAERQAERASVKAGAKIQRQREHDERERRRADERMVKLGKGASLSAHSTDKATVRRAHKLGIDLAPPESTVPTTPTYQWDPETHQIINTGSVPATHPTGQAPVQQFDWQVAGLPEPLPER